MTEHPRDDAPTDASVDTRVDAPVERTADANTRLVRALPAPVFTVVYGAIVISLVTGGIFLVDKVSSAEESAPSVGKPVRPANPVVTSEANVGASVRPYLIADAKAARTSSGVTLTGTMTPTAEESLSEFSGHVSRLLEQNCIDNMTVTSQDNLRVNLWGYCYSSPGPESLETYLSQALDSDADSVTFAFYGGREIEHVADIKWFAESTSDADRAVSEWEDAEVVGNTDKLTLTAYDPQRVRVHDIFADRLDRDDFSDEDVTGEAFREKWEIPPKD